MLPWDNILLSIGCSLIASGIVILMHDLYESTAEACEVVIPELIRRGYQLVTIDELFYYKGIELENHELYHHG